MSVSKLSMIVFFAAVCLAFFTDRVDSVLEVVAAVSAGVAAVALAVGK